MSCWRRDTWVDENIVSYTQDDQPCSSLLNELSLMSAGKPSSPRFTVSPPNRSTFPVKALVPSVLCCWGRLTVQHSARTPERTGQHTLWQNHPLTSGESLKVNVRTVMLLRYDSNLSAKRQLLFAFNPACASRAIRSYVNVRHGSCINTVMLR